jgi:hypothetical protein
MNPVMQASPINVLLGLGLLVGRLSLIETFAAGAMGVIRGGGVGLVMGTSLKIAFGCLIEMSTLSDYC